MLNANQLNSIRTSVGKTYQADKERRRAALEAASKPDITDKVFVVITAIVGAAVMVFRIRDASIVKQLPKP